MRRRGHNTGHACNDVHLWTGLFKNLYRFRKESLLLFTGSAVNSQNHKGQKLWPQRHHNLALWSKWPAQETLVFYHIPFYLTINLVFFQKMSIPFEWKQAIITHAPFPLITPILAVHSSHTSTFAAFAVVSCLCALMKIFCDWPEKMNRTAQYHRQTTERVFRAWLTRGRWRPLDGVAHLSTLNNNMTSSDNRRSPAKAKTQCFTSYWFTVIC